jgi:hypothetical protein
MAMLNYREELRGLVEWMDTDLDNNVADRYKEQPFAQDWARVAKVAEETGEAIDALIGWTGQNPRKGVYCAPENLHEELCDVALTGLYALQHFLKDGDKTMNVLLARARYHRQRKEACTPGEIERRDGAERRQYYGLGAMCPPPYVPNPKRTATEDRRKSWPRWRGWYRRD